MDADIWVMGTRLVGALLIGSIVGLDRTFRARPAGFRTHAIVCMSCTAAMLTMVMLPRWTSSLEIKADGASRVIQGLVTGIGFLGAGVIFKDGLSVRGLTTAATIWMTAAIGILIGVGLWFPAILGAALTLFVLTILGKLEDRLPSEYHAHCQLRFAREKAPSLAELGRLVGRHGLEMADVFQSLIDEGRYLEFHMMVRGKSPDASQSLAEELMEAPGVIDFRFSARGE